MLNLKISLDHFLKKFLPLLLVIAVALTIAFQNIDTNTIYSGWDNIHAEFDLGRYARQVFFGAWNEHQGLGAPAAQAQLSEVPRLPILFILTNLLPASLVRYAFIFLMFLIGGLTMYAYLAKVWLSETKSLLKYWLSGLGAVFYLLHILTLQQFYISFEMFTVQFAFLPLVLLSIHRLAKQTDAKAILLFIGGQLLIAPSAHTPTVFYLAAFFSVIYAFFLLAKDNILQAVKFTILIGLLTATANAYWLLPNLYYSLHNLSYVSESRENQIFAPESVWSVREAGTLTNLTVGTHYLFSWRDYSFETKEFEFIFNEWESHLSQLPVQALLYLLGGLTIGGALLTLTANEKGPKRWAILGMYAFCLAFIWIDLFPTSAVINRLYQSASFREAFRNPFTKLSIIYSFVSVLLFVQAAKWLVQAVRHKRWLIGGHHLAGLVIVGLLLTIGCTAWPSFQGHFISEKLKIEYPAEYSHMFNYLKTRDRDLRVLALPQFSHVAWEYYDWSFLKPGNGYQGMGFYFFGFPQAFLNRDADRWSETSDFFFHQLKYALDANDLNQFERIIEKYRVDLIVIDETKQDPNRPHDYQRDHSLVQAAGFTKVWQENFLTVYEYKTGQGEQSVFGPIAVTLANGLTDRVKTDAIYNQTGHYLIADPDQASIIYPLSDLLAHRLDKVNLTDSRLTLVRSIPAGKFQLSLPSASAVRERYFTPAAITYSGRTVSVKFPTLALVVGDETHVLPGLSDFQFNVTETADELLVFFDTVGVVVKHGQTAYPILEFSTEKQFVVDYTVKPTELKYLPSGNIDDTNLQTRVVDVLSPDWPRLLAPLTLAIEGPTTLGVVSDFPTFDVDLLQNPAVNCSQGERGQITTKPAGETVLYQADSFGVNCGGYAFEYLSSAYSYVMKLTGENQLGRSTKFFISYTDERIHPEDYLMPSGKFSQFLTLSQLTDDPRSIFYLNWETRSFGKEDVNELTGIQVSPLPLERLAELQLLREGSQEIAPNPIEIVSEHTYLNSVSVARFNCASEPCFISLDQAHDDLWLAFQFGRLGLLPHARYDNWANAWQVKGEQGIVIMVYLPELVALISMGGLIIWLIKLKAQAHDR
jgi:hypothetical protein